MSYINGLDHVERRPSVVRLTGKEAIEKLNEITDAANVKIANALGQARHFEQIATDLAEENRQLLAEAERLMAENRELRARLKMAEADLAKARKRVKAARVME